MKAVTFEECDEDLEYSLGVGGEAAVAVGAETLDKMCDDVVQTLKWGDALNRGTYDKRGVRARTSGAQDDESNATTQPFKGQVYVQQCGVT